MAEQAHVHSLGLRHHFDNLEQQYEAGTMGMWVFLVTEIMFFGALFCSYALYRSVYPEAWALGSHLNSPTLGAAMTVVLLMSSLSMALGVRWAALGNQRVVVWMLWLTIFLGLAFMGMKGFEYYHHFEDKLVPGYDFSGYHGPYSGQVQMFISFYFIMTAIHATHMVVGVGIMLTMIWMTRRGRFDAHYYTPIEIAGLYWHFVDVIWIFLFPMLYLVDLHK